MALRHDALATTPAVSPREAHARLHPVLDASPDALMIVETDGCVSFLSREAQTAFGVERSLPPPGSHWLSYYPEDDVPELTGLLADALSGRTGTGAVDAWDGQPGLWTLTLSPILDNGSVSGVLATQRWAAAVETNDLRVRETDHRIKNSLSSVASLLRMQARRSPEQLAEPLAAAADRVLAIGSVHGHLRPDLDPQSGDSHVCVARYIQPLLKHLVSVFGPGRITLLREIEPMPLDPRAAVAVGLIVTEAVTNACRHGFGDDPEGGLVHVEIGQDLGESRVIRVTDRGRGLPDEFDWTASRRIGGRILSLYSQSLGGRLSVAPAPGGGTRLEVLF
ncbi:MAG: histidine kinase dimerization/phosphoacceptor domain -containing protein [Litorimonas sp.]